MRNRTQSIQIVPQEQITLHDRTLKNVQELARKLATGLTAHNDLLSSVAWHSSDVYDEETYQRRRWFFFTVTETSEVRRPQTLVKVLEDPKVYITVDGTSSGQFVQRFGDDKLHVIDPDILHTPTLQELEKQMNTIYQTLFPE